MATSIDVNVGLTGSVRLREAGLPNPAAETVTLGSSFAALALSLADGTGPGQAKQVFSEERTLAAAATYDYDLRALSNRLTATVVMSAVKLLVLKVKDPLSTKSLTLGTAGVASPVSGWFAGTSPTLAVRDALIFWDAVTGLPVSGSAKGLRVVNPSAVSVTYQILIVGVV